MDVAANGGVDQLRNEKGIIYLWQEFKWFGKDV